MSLFGIQSSDYFCISSGIITSGFPAENSGWRKKRVPISRFPENKKEQAFLSA